MILFSYFNCFWIVKSSCSLSLILICSILYLFFLLICFPALLFSNAAFIDQLIHHFNSKFLIYILLPGVLLIRSYAYFLNMEQMCLTFELNLYLSSNCYIFQKTSANYLPLECIYLYAPNRFFFPLIFPKWPSSCFEVNLHFKLAALFLFQIANFNFHLFCFHLTKLYPSNYSHQVTKTWFAAFVILIYF